MILSLISYAFAATIAGVQFPESTLIEEHQLVLNGAGLREKYWIDIYAAALYLPEQSQDAVKIIAQDTPKRIHIHFIYHRVTKDQMIETLDENFSRNPNINEGTIASIKQTFGWMEDFKRGDEIIFDYAPETGTTIYVKGKEKGTIKGNDFMEAIYTIYLGPKPASVPLKESMLRH